MPGSRFAAETCTPSELPEPEVAFKFNHELDGEACHVTGRAQVPLSLSATASVDEVVCPCVRVRAREVGAGVESLQGGRTVSVTVKVCILPCTVTLLKS